MPMGIGPGLSVTRGGSVTGIGAIGADLAMWFDNDQAYKSSGGGVVTPDSILTYAAPSPKMVYGATGVLGYAAHNKFLYSEQLDNAAWTKNSIVGGTVIAGLIIPADASAKHSVAQATSHTGASIVRAQVKAAGYKNVALNEAAQTGNSSEAFDLSNGNKTVVTGTSGTSTITPLGDGWYEISWAGTWGGGNSKLFNLVVLPDVLTGVNPNSHNWTADGIKGVYATKLSSSDGLTALTYIPTTTAAKYSLPRDHNPTTGAALGVLVEEARTNLLLRSQEFDNAAWVKTFGADVGVTATAAVAPDGTNTAYLVWAAEANGYHNIRQGVTVAGAVQSWSVYVKAQNYNKVGIREDFAVGQYATFLLSGSGSVIDKTGGTTATITALVNSWYRITFTGTSTSANMGIGIYIMDAAYTAGDPSSYSYTGNNADGLYLWGAQQEAGAFATSYIPTVASQVTRAADQISILTSAFPYSATAGTVVFEGDRIVYPIGASGWYALLLDSSNYISSLASSGGGVEQFIVRAAGTTTQAYAPAGAINTKAAHAYKADDSAASLNGSAAVKDTTVTVPSGITTLHVGRGTSTSTYLNGHIKRLAYYASRKTDAELQVLST